MEKKGYGYLAIQDDVFKKHKKAARAEADMSGMDDKNYLQFSEDVFFLPDEVIAEKGKTISINGQIYIGKEELAYISLEIPITLDLAQDIVEAYLKHVNRLKGMLELANSI